MKAKILPRIKAIYPHENPYTKLLDLCEVHPQREVAVHLGVDESSVSKMKARLEAQKAKFNN